MLKKNNLKLLPVINFLSTIYNIKWNGNDSKIYSSCKNNFSNSAVTFEVGTCLFYFLNSINLMIYLSPNFFYPYLGDKINTYINLMARGIKREKDFNCQYAVSFGE